MSSKNNNSLIVQPVLTWYRNNARSLPWRKTRNPYRILVFEVMLQQTQVSRVLQKYPEFLRRYPNFSVLAGARTADVIRSWAGMGYNNRAMRLHQIAKIVIEKYRGRLPQDVEILQSLPGIGRYTANAIACFAFVQQVAVVDTNIRRVLGRLFPAKVHQHDEWELAESLLPPKRAYDWNQALMELGAVICTASNPSCTDCPIRKFCPSAFKIDGRKKAKRNTKATIIPNRIYRGRIISILREKSSRQTIESNVLLKKLRPDSLTRHKKWFMSILSGLERDGLIQIRSRNSNLYISLPL